MESHNATDADVDNVKVTMFVWNTFSGLSFAAVFMIIIFITICTRVLILGQKTRSPQQRRMYVGSRARPSLGPHEPTIYVSPSNLPPPPKYECMAPPSYEEVVGIHYPNYQVQQPIAQPIADALAQSTQPSTAAQANETATRSNDEAVVVTVNERPTVTSS